MSDHEPIVGQAQGSGPGADVTVRVLPLGSTFTVAPNESVLAAARRSGLRWPSVCNGQGSCTVCYMQIEEGMAHAGLEGPSERERLYFAGRRDPSFRLACQTQPKGSLIVFKRGVKPEAPPS
jgi:2Fe-2S ferredoxin